jgi:hypothetical protein
LSKKPSTAEGPVETLVYYYYDYYDGYCDA